MSLIVTALGSEMANMRNPTNSSDSNAKIPDIARNIVFMLST